jgi:hypothetical protein
LNAGVKRRYRQFAEMECQGYAEVYYGLALAVFEDEEVAGFISEMPVIQLGRTQLTNGRRRDELLALAHPHGADLRWL